MARSVCTACGKVFSSTGTFDAHRIGSYGGPIHQGGRKVIGFTPSARRCMTTEEILAAGKLSLEEQRGYWKGAEENNYWQERKAREEQEA